MVQIIYLEGQCLTVWENSKNPQKPQGKSMRMSCTHFSRIISEHQMRIAYPNFNHLWKCVEVVGSKYSNRLYCSYTIIADGFPIALIEGGSWCPTLKMLNNWLLGSRHRIKSFSVCFAYFPKVRFCGPVGDGDGHRMHSEAYLPK